jgi:hypothetical protein
VAEDATEGAENTSEGEDGTAPARSRSTRRKEATK